MDRQVQVAIVGPVAPHQDLALFKILVILLEALASSS